MYSFPDPDAPIRQGDIFRWLPKVELTLGPEHLPLISEPMEEGGAREIDWFQLAVSNGEGIANVLVRPAIGIVITQDCDADRCANVAFAEVVLFGDIFKDYKESFKPKSLVGLVTNQTRKNQKWYYLADNQQIGFANKMGVDFQSVFEVRREMLENHKELMRLGRLDDNVAWPHFRERVAEFFRRYPYNEWYPFNLEEVKAYEKSYGGITVDPYYAWQRE